MGDRDFITKSIHMILPKASVEVLEFVYFYLLECDPARTSEADT